MRRHGWTRRDLGRGPARGIAALLTAALPIVAVTGLGTTAAAEGHGSAGPVTTVVSAVRASDGSRHTITNHLTTASRPAADRSAPRREYLLVWAGDEEASSAATPDPDFLAVVDATRGPRYG